MASASRTSQVQTSFQDISVNAMRWDEEMSKADASVSKSDLNALVFEYLLIEGFSEAAVELARETGLPYDVNHELIQERIQIREAVEDGRVEEAVRRVNELDPEILDTNPPLLFHLHLLRLIELIRSEKIDEALQFATNELAPRGAENPEFLADLERTMALLAFPDLARFADDAVPSSHGGAPSRPAPDASTLELLQDPAFVPISSLMRRNQRVKVAKELNAAILESQGQGSETKLSGLVRLMSWGEEKARNAGIKIPAVSDRASQSWADQVLALEAA